MKSLLFVCITFLTFSTHVTAQCNISNNLALDRMVTATSQENSGTRASFAVDGNTATRWSSEASDAQSITVDLGAIKSLCRVELLWESAYASGFNIEISNDEIAWTTVATITGNTSLSNTIPVSANGRFVRMTGITRATGYGYSLYEFRVFGTAPTPACAINLAFQRPAFESSQENLAFPVANAFDGDLQTRFSSEFNDDEYMYVDLGARYPLCTVEIFWEAAYATAYRIELSNDAVNWTVAANITGNTGLHNTIPMSGSARYVKMHGVSRATQYGYSIWEMRVFGSSATLPVKWISFSGIIDSDKKVRLDWTTAEEINNAGYEIQRKTDNDADFVVIGTMLPAVSSGEKHQYRFFDNSPSDGVNYYRIKQTDRDNQTSFSKTVIVENKRSATSVVIYPNPVTSQLHIKDGGLQLDFIRVYTNDGRKLQEYNHIARGQTITIQMSAYPRGTYLVQTGTSNGLETKKIVKE